MKRTILTLLIGLMMVLSLGLVSAQTCDFEIDRHSDEVMFIPGTLGGFDNEYTVNCLVSQCDDLTITNNMLVNEAVNGVASEFVSGSTSHWRGLPEYVNDGNIYTYHTMYNNPAWQIDFDSPKEIVGGKVLFDYLFVDNADYYFNQYEVRALIGGSWELIYESSKNDTNEWHVFMFDEAVVTDSLRLRFDLEGEFHNNRIKLFQWELLSKELVPENMGDVHIVDIPPMNSNTDFLSSLLPHEPMYYSKHYYFDVAVPLTNHAFVDVVSNGSCSFNSVWSVNLEPFGDNVLNEDTGVYYATVQDAVDSASPGDTLRLFEQEYYENVVITKDLSLIGEGSANTVIKGVVHDASVISVLGEEGAEISVVIEGMTLDHQNLHHVEQFGSVSGVSASRVDGLVIRDVHAINLGEEMNFQYERGGFSIGQASNVLIEDVEVRNVYGTFTRGIRIFNSNDVEVDGFVMSDIHTDSIQDWLFYLHTVENSSFRNAVYEDLTVHGSNQVTLRAIDLDTSFNNVFEDISIKNVNGIYNNVPIKLERSSHNEFRNLDLKNMEAAFIASAIEVTDSSENNLFEDIRIENFKADVQSRGINVDRGAKNNTFRNIVIDNFQGELTGMTTFSVIGINVNVRDPDGNTENNLFENISFTRVNTTGNFYGVNLNSIASNAYNQNNVFKGLNMELGEEDEFVFAAGFRDNSDCGNSLIDSLFVGFTRTIDTVNQEPECLFIQNNKILRNEEALTNIDVSRIDEYCMNNYFDFLGFVLSDNLVHGNMKNTMDLFDLADPLKAVAVEDVHARTRNEDIVVRVIFPEGVEVTRADEEVIDKQNFVGEMKEETYTIDGKESAGVLKLGHTTEGLIYSSPVSIEFNFLNGFEGVEMSIYRSLDGEEWTTDGLLEDTCVVEQGACGFETTKASLYVLVYEPEQETTGTTSGTRYLPDGTVLGAQQPTQPVAPAETTGAPLFAIGGDIGDWAVPWYFWVLLVGLFLFFLFRRRDKDKKNSSRRRKR